VLYLNRFEGIAKYFVLGRIQARSIGTQFSSASALIWLLPYTERSGSPTNVKTKLPLVRATSNG